MQGRCIGRRHCSSWKIGTVSTADDFAFDNQEEWRKGRQQRSHGMDIDGLNIDDHDRHS
jgi:hypothetical protein